ncbi:type III polyketide synthase [Kitasatospora sp. NPDC006697]|uniref:type III polyketide synthase n=1 Tax=Kitasatospora sp. NPDC006697 TaxID=3364020 RepID=UPI003676677B
MSVLCPPEVHFPEHEVTLEDTLAAARRLHPRHPRLDTVLSLIENTGVRTRRILQPLEATLAHPGVAARTGLYWQAVRTHLPGVVAGALERAEVSRDQIHAVVFVSCTGFSMPSPIVWMVNELGLPTGVDQIPLAQLGCAAGSGAISAAARYCRAHPDRNVLIVAFELCSLCYQPTDSDVGALLSAGLFGDGFAAAVMRGTARSGLRIERSASETISGTADWISYDVRETGFHFRLDSRVRHTMRAVTPSIGKLVAEAGTTTGQLDFVLAHAGGPRILADLTRYLDIDPALHRFSRAALSEHGNTASVLIFDSLARFWDDGAARPGARGIIAGFGPGVSADFSLGVVL